MGQSGEGGRGGDGGGGGGGVRAEEWSGGFGVERELEAAEGEEVHEGGTEGHDKRDRGWRRKTVDR